MTIRAATIFGAMVLAVPASAQWQPVIKSAPQTAAPAAEAQPPLPSTVADGFKFAAGGDLLGPYRTRAGQDYPELEEIGRIFRGADVGFANLESNLFDSWAFDGHPAAENGGFEQGGIGSGPIIPAAAAAELKALGITLVSTANNHSLDWGIEGLRATRRTLKEAGIAGAGTGESLAEARAPGFVDTSRGRVGLVGAASTFMPMAPAGPGSPEGRNKRLPRPGIAALRTRPIGLVTGEEFAVLKRIAERQGKPVGESDTEVTLAPNEAVFIQQSFRKSETPGLTYELNGDDRDGLLRAVRLAKQNADFAAFSIHAHETDTGGQELDADPAGLGPADFLPSLFHDMVDAGADVVLTHGPHVPRAIEIYKGKPIFYGLGSLFFELGSAWRSEWYDSFIAVSEYREGKAWEIRLYPIMLGAEAEARPRHKQGIPRRATGGDARRILADLQRQSARFGTQIEIEKDIGVIRPR